MKRLVALILSLILPLSLCACSQNMQPQDESKLQVMASCFPYYDYRNRIISIQYLQHQIKVSLFISCIKSTHGFRPNLHPKPFFH